jgi:APA family basic amino acid/polyamine antiporter
MRKVHPKYRTPHIATAITTISRRSGLPRTVPLNILGELISMGILLAFTGVCIGVLVLRYTKPDLQRRSACRWLRSPAWSAR